MHICYFLTGIPHGNFLLSIFFLKSRFSCPVHPGFSYLPAIPCLSGISGISGIAKRSVYDPHVIRMLSACYPHLFSIQTRVIRG